MILSVLRTALLLVTAAVLCLSSFQTLGLIMASGDVMRLATVIDRNQAYRQELIEKGETFDYSAWLDPSVLKQVSNLVDPLQSATDCLSDVSRASLSVELGLLDQAFLSEASDRRLRSLVAQADRIAAERLKCSPIDGNAWLLRARLAALQYNDLSGIGPYLDLSYLYAPAEKWIMMPRLKFVDNLLDNNRIAPPPAFASDLQRFVNLSLPFEIASLYSDGGNVARGVMRFSIDAQRLDRRVQILRWVDTLGVSYPVPADCIPKLDKSIPGSELAMRRPADLIAACAK